jgi:hypothetical protein
MVWNIRFDVCRGVQRCGDTWEFMLRYVSGMVLCLGMPECYHSVEHPHSNIGHSYTHTIDYLRCIKWSNTSVKSGTSDFFKEWGA